MLLPSKLLPISPCLHLPLAKAQLLEDFHTPGDRRDRTVLMATREFCIKLFLLLEGLALEGRSSPMKSMSSFWLIRPHVQLCAVL